jgi:hypothetical protein
MQRVCVECGHDVTRAARRSRGARAWLAAGALAVLAIGVGSGFAIAQLTNDNQKKKASNGSVAVATAVPPPAAHPPTTPPTAVPELTAPTTPTPTTKTAPSRPRGRKPSHRTSRSGSGSVASWPPGKTAYTVVLISPKSRSQAYSKARQAKRNGIDAGVLHSNDYSSLNPGYWVVFVGQYKTMAKAQSHVGDYTGKGFPAGYARLVKK